MAEIPISPSVVHFNIRGLIANFFNLQIYLSVHGPDVVCLQETMLGPNSTLNHKQPIEFRNYKLYRNDCQAGKWGVAILIKEDIPHSLMDIRSTLQQITIKMHYMGREMSVTSLYLPPSVG